MRCYDHCAIQTQQLVNRKISDVEVAVTRRELEKLCKRIIRITAITDDEIAVAAVHDHGVEPQNTADTSGANRSFFNRATALAKHSIHDLHL